MHPVQGRKLVSHVLPTVEIALRLSQSVEIPYVTALLEKTAVVVHLTAVHVTPIAGMEFVNIIIKKIVSYVRKIVGHVHPRQILYVEMGHVTGLKHVPTALPTALDHVPAQME